MRQLTAVVLSALALAPPAAAAGPAQLTVLAASSLTDVLPALDHAERYSFAGSDALAFQIRQGAPADVFAAASPKYPEQLYRLGLVEKPQAFATNSLVVIVPRANPAHIRSIFDLRRRGIKLVLGAAGVPVGDYTRKVLAKLGLTKVLANVVSEETDVRGVVAKVSLGEADAGFVYVTDVHSVAGKVKEITIPARAQPTVRYEVAVVESSRHLAAARAFVRRLLGPAGRRELRRFGFGLP
jgi:molybdate transport system substrate-binding protein